MRRMMARRRRRGRRAEESALNQASFIHLLVRIAPHAMEWAVILLPVTVYLLVLGMVVARQPQPVVVGGRRSFFWLLLAVSGIFLLGPPSWVVHSFRYRSDLLYFLAYANYVMVLLFSAWILVRRQRTTLVVYNIDPKYLSDLVQGVLDQLNQPYQLTPGRIALLHGRQVLDVEASPLWHCATFTWKGGDEALRQAVEDRLRKALADVPSQGNPAATVLTLWGVLLACYTTAATMLFLWYLAYISP
jgi:hypothetical protein